MLQLEAQLQVEEGRRSAYEAAARARAEELEARRAAAPCVNYVELRARQRRERTTLGSSQPEPSSPLRRA